MVVYLVARVAAKLWMSLLVVLLEGEELLMLELEVVVLLLSGRRRGGDGVGLGLMMVKLKLLTQHQHRRQRQPRCQHRLPSTLGGLLYRHDPDRYQAL